MQHSLKLFVTAYKSNVVFQRVGIYSNTTIIMKAHLISVPFTSTGLFGDKILKSSVIHLFERAFLRELNPKRVIGVLFRTHSSGPRSFREEIISRFHFNFSVWSLFYKSSQTYFINNFHKVSISFELGCCQSSRSGS